MTGRLTEEGHRVLQDSLQSGRAAHDAEREADYGHRRDLFDPETALERQERYSRELRRRLFDLPDARIWAAGWRSTRRRSWLPRPALDPADASQL